MRLFDYPEAKQVIVSGAAPDDFDTIVNTLCLKNKCPDTLLIVAGDSGFGYREKAVYEELYNTKYDGYLLEENNWVVFVRGNYDDPSYYEEQKINYPRWRTVPDYSVIQAAGHNILCVGGAITTDRLVRKMLDDMNSREVHTFFWQDEAPVLKLEEIISIPPEIKIDTVVTHTAPSRCEPPADSGLKRWPDLDPDLLHDIANERATMDQIEKCLKDYGHPVKNWFYGHFHQSGIATLNGIKFSMLDKLEFRIVK